MKVGNLNKINPLFWKVVYDVIPFHIALAHHKINLNKCESYVMEIWATFLKLTKTI